MTLNGKKVTEVNATYKEQITRNRLDLNVGHDDFWSDSIYKGNWQVCRIEEIGDLIKELTIMKETLEEVVGIML